jgi:hypothetical protein
MCQWKPDRCIIYQRRNILASELDPKIDINWEDGEIKFNSVVFWNLTDYYVIKALAEPTECTSVESNHPLYILCKKPLNL